MLAKAARSPRPMQRSLRTRTPRTVCRVFFAGASDEQKLYGHLCAARPPLPFGAQPSELFDMLLRWKDAQSTDAFTALLSNMDMEMRRDEALRTRKSACSQVSDAACQCLVAISITCWGVGLCIPWRVAIRY
jgi:hypothetical protein